MILKTLLSSVLLISFFIVSDVSAHTGGVCSGAGKRIAAGPPEINEVRPFDVLSYDLQLDWRRPFAEQTTIFSGIQEIRFKVTSLTERIVLDATTLHIDSAWVDGVRLDPTPQSVEDKLNFDFDIPLQPGTEMTIRMAYTREQAIYRGAYFFPKGLAHGFELRDTVLEDIIYTQSEPFDAQFWMPCMNLPYDKADARISIRVPEGITGISNGLLENTISHEDGSKTFVWKSDKPLATYLMVANASTFVQWEDFYLRPSDPTDTVRTLYFAWPDDYDNTAENGTEHNPRYAFRNTPEIMLEFTRLFGEYPFEQYGQVPVAPYGYGGMEHQGMTTVNRFWLLGFDELGIAHEIGHHWFGNKVTCETWNDLWLNEGFATYTEGLWTEATLGEEAYLTLIGEHVTSYFDHGTYVVPIYGISPMQAFVWPYSPVVYSKSMAVIHQLRRLVNNDTLFFNSLRDYLETFAYSNVTTEEFETYMNARLGIDLTQFMDQWIFGPGHPTYRIRWNSTENRLGFRIEQRQNEQDVFVSPVRLFVTYEDESLDTIVVENTERVQFYSFTLPKNVLTIQQDEDWSILSTRSIARDFDIVLSVDGKVAPQIVMWNTRASLNISSSEPLSGKLTVVDILGRSVLSENFVLETMHRIAIDRLSPGAYFVMLETSEGRKTHRFEIH